MTREAYLAEQAKQSDYEIFLESLDDDPNFLDDYDDDDDDEDPLFAVLNSMTFPCDDCQHEMDFADGFCNECGKLYEEEYWQAIESDIYDIILNRDESTDPDDSDYQLQWEYEAIDEEDFVKLEMLIPDEQLDVAYGSEECQNCVFNRKQDCASYRGWVLSWHELKGKQPSYQIFLCDDFIQNPTP